MSDDVDKEWNKLVHAHTDAVSEYGAACAEEARAWHAAEAAKDRVARAENARMVKKQAVEAALGALLKRAAATGRA